MIAHVAALDHILRCIIVLGSTLAIASIGSGCGTGLNPIGKRKDAAVGDGSSALTGCKDFAFAPIQTWRHQQANITLSISGGAKLASVKIDNPGALEAAATVDWEGGVGDMSGLVISRPALAGDAVHQVQEIAAQLAREKIFKAVNVRHPGRLAVSPDGYPMVSGILIDLSLETTAQINWARNNLFPLLLGGELVRFRALPQPHQTSGQAFVLIGSLVLRRAAKANVGRGQILFSGGVITLKDYENRNSLARIRAADLANGTAVTGFSGKLTGRCADATLTVTPKVDFIWVLDERDAILKSRIRLHDSVPALWTEAVKLGLDFRMAVVGMGRRGDGASSFMNGLCNTVYNEPGAFWSSFSSGDLPPQLQPCILGPSGNHTAGSGSHGLINMRETLISLLPRKAGETRKLRPGAATVVLFVSDRPPDLLSEVFGGKAPLPPFSPGQRSILEDTVAPFATLLMGEGGSETTELLPGATALSELAGTLVYALTTKPGVGCGRDRRGTGYLELAAAVGGGDELICYNEAGLEHVLEGVVQDVARRTRPLALAGKVISASLTTRLEGTKGAVLARSRKQGFDYHPDSNSLLIYNGTASSSTLSGKMKVSYLSW